MNPDSVRKPFPCLSYFIIQLSPRIVECGGSRFYNFSPSGLCLPDGCCGYLQSWVVLLGYLYRLFQADGLWGLCRGGGTQQKCR